VILILDNYDSFTYNLADYVGRFAEVRVERNDALTLDQIKAMAPDGIVISPGPGHPANERDFGVCTQVLRQLGPTTPVLGVCLGHEGIVHAYGGRIVHARRVLHGKTSQIEHDGQGVFRGMPQPMTGTRYHSLIAERSSLPRDLVVTAEADGEIMGVRHRTHPVEGVQFHPESIATEQGLRMIENFIESTRRKRG
jgi:anthranilate synthase/aminodeoxychorismate synthase-like glutamine amidotransferase